MILTTNWRTVYRPCSNMIQVITFSSVFWSTVAEFLHTSIDLLPVEMVLSKLGKQWIALMLTLQPYLETIKRVRVAIAFSDGELHRLIQNTIITPLEPWLHGQCSCSKEVVVTWLPPGLESGRSIYEKHCPSEKAVRFLLEASLHREAIPGVGGILGKIAPCGPMPVANHH